MKLFSQQRNENENKPYEDIHNLAIIRFVKTIP